MPASRQVIAIVLKRHNYGEADRIVTVFSPQEGKISCMARGVRRTESKKRSALEPGTVSKLFLAESHGMPLITQAVALNEFSGLKASLQGTKKLLQILEMIDSVVMDPDASVFDGFLEILSLMESYPNLAGHEVSSRLNIILQQLGFQDIAETSFLTITEYVEYLAEKKLKSWEYLHS